MPEKLDNQKTQFKAHLESHGSRLNMLDRPEPPEAICELNDKRTWIEITDAFLDRDHAIGLTSFASDNMDHVPDDRRLVIDPDAMFSSVLHADIEAKYDKASMQKVAEAEGPGILLVGIFTPFVTAEAVAHDEADSVAILIASKAVPVFGSIYAYEGTGQRNFHVIYQREA